jgi:site-specific DNA recombinase
VKRSRVEHVVLDGLKSRLMKPEMVQAFIRGFTDRMNHERATAELAKSAAASQLARLKKKLRGYYDAVADGIRTPGIREQILELESKQEGLQRQIEDAAASEPRLHPRLADTYRDMMADLQASLADPAGRDQAAQIIRGLVERITVRQDATGQIIELTGNILKLLPLAGGGVPAPYQSSVKVVAGAGFDRELKCVC